MQSKGFVYSPGPFEARRFAASGLRWAGLALSRLARRLQQRQVAASRTHHPVLEYHADAGAPEGALYVDGQLVGHVLGVSRL